MNNDYDLEEEFDLEDDLDLGNDDDGFNLNYYEEFNKSVYGNPDESSHMGYGGGGAREGPPKKKGIGLIGRILISIVVLVVVFRLITVFNKPVSDGYADGSGGTYTKEAQVVKITNYINDYANVVSDDTESYLNELGKRMDNETGSQIVFVTVNSLDGMDIREVAYKTFNHYKLGSSEKNNGILFITAIEDKLRYMEVGVGLEDVITDIASQHLQRDYLVPYFKDGEYSEGVYNLYVKTVESLIGEYDIPHDDGDIKNTGKGIKMLLFIIVGAVVLVLVLFCIGGFDLVFAVFGFILYILPAFASLGSGGRSGGGRSGGGRSGGGGAGGSW